MKAHIETDDEYEKRVIKVDIKNLQGEIRELRDSIVQIQKFVRDLINKVNSI